MKTNAMRSSLRCLFDTARQYATDIVRCTGFTALAALGIFGAEWLIVPTLLFELETAQPLSTVLWTLAAAMLLLFLLYGIQTYIEGTFSECRDRYRTRGSTALVRKVLTLSYSRATDAQYQQRLRRAAEATGRHIHAPIPRMWYTLSQWLFHAMALIVLAVVLMCWNPTVTLIAAITSVIGAFVHRTVSRLGERERHTETEQKEVAEEVSRAAESPSFSKDIRIFGLQRWLCEVYDRAVHSTEIVLRRRGRIYFVYNAADAVLTFFRNAVAYAVLAEALVAGTISVSYAVLCFTAIGGFTACIGGVLQDGWSLCVSLKALSMYCDVLTEEDDILTDGGVVPQSGVPHTLCLNDVSVVTKTGDALLSHVSFTLHYGETLAVVGDDPLGKRALVRLLCGLQDPTSGAVTLDGMDIRVLDRRAYYALLSTVLSENTASDMTVLECVSASNEEADVARVWSCLETVELADTVRLLPQGINTHIGSLAFEDGVDLSGGQRQRLFLARALYKNGDIRILEEPQATLDPLAEQRCYKEFIKVSHGKSTVVISNRPTVASLCDRIVYLKNGTIAEEGTHEELLLENGDYAKLFRLQSRYYREGRDPDGEAYGE